MYCFEDLTQTHWTGHFQTVTYLKILNLLGISFQIQYEKFIEFINITDKFVGAAL